VLSGSLSIIGLSGARIMPPIPMPRLKLLLAWLSLRLRQHPNGGAYRLAKSHIAREVKQLPLRTPQVGFAGNGREPKPPALDKLSAILVAVSGPQICTTSVVTPVLLRSTTDMCPIRPTQVGSAPGAAS
jgi:hypothetical protein